MATADAIVRNDEVVASITTRQLTGAKAFASVCE
jgi:hypothetical protein